MVDNEANTDAEELLDYQAEDPIDWGDKPKRKQKQPMPGPGRPSGGGGCSPGRGLLIGCGMTLLLIFGCAALAFGLFTGLMKPAYETTRNFMNALHNQDYVAAYELMDSSLQNEIGSPEDLRQRFESNGLSLEAWSWRNLRSFNIENNVGEFRGVIDTANGETWTMELGLANRGGWKITRFNFIPPG